MEKICDDCGRKVTLTEDGYCTICGKHADNMKSFSVFTVTSYTVGENSPPMYVHWAKGLSMFIKKDGVSIRLNSEEIQELVKSLPRTVGGTY